MKNKGITLIALVITIIILLILAGVSISLIVGENGILNKATKAVVITEIKEIEEAARFHYMNRKVDEILESKEATMAGVISDLKAQGYHIEEKISGESIVTGIVLSEKDIKMNKNSEASVTYTFVYGEGTVRYYAEVRGKYYEIVNENENIIVRTEETDLEGINKAPKVTVASNTGIVTARVEENDTIVINSLNDLGEGVVTITEENSGVTTACNVKVMTLIESITFKQETITIEKGNNIDLSTLVTVNPTDATEELIWTSGNREIIEVTEDGKLVGVKEGTVTLKVTNEAGTIESTCSVKVIISATGISLNKSTTTINKGSTDSLTVSLTPADTTEPVSWTAESTSIATLIPDATGRTATVTAVGAGTTKITVTCGSQTTYCTVQVKVPATGLTISQTSATLQLTGGNSPTLQLTATATPPDTTDTISWKSSPTTVATVSNNGLVTAVAGGTATITVTCGNQTKTCIVTTNIPVTSIAISKTEAILEVGKTVSLTAEVKPNEATSKELLWSSNDVRIATVTQDGLVTVSKDAVPGSTVSIKVSSKDFPEVETQCTIKVKGAPIVVADYVSSVLNKGLNQYFNYVRHSELIKSGVNNNGLMWLRQ